MKRFTMNCMMTAVVALTAVAASAQAQTKLKAEIPFAFRSGDVTLAPGAYTVSMVQTTQRSWLKIENVDSKRPLLISQFTMADAPKAWMKDGSARLAFACVESRCALQSLWTGDGSMAYQFSMPKHESGAQVRMAEIRLSSNKAD